MLTQMLEAAEEMFGRQLTTTEISLITRMHAANKDWEYVAEILKEETPPEPSDDELETTRYEAAGRMAIEIPPG